MGIHHQYLITCDQQPLPLRCTAQLVVHAGPEHWQVAVQVAVRKRDWGVTAVNNKGDLGFYCPVHRATHQPDLTELMRRATIS